MWIDMFLVQVESLLHNNVIIIVNVVFTQIWYYSVS